MRGRSFLVAGFLLFGGLLGACSSGGSGGTPTFQSPPGQGPVTLGGLPANVPYANTSSSGYVSIPAGITVPTGDGVSLVVQPSPLPGMPTLSSVARHPASLPTGSIVVLYYGLTFLQATVLAGGIGFSYVPPTGTSLTTGQYFIAAYDPTASNPQWSHPLLGPAIVSGTPASLQFAGLPGTTMFAAGVQYGFALYEVKGGTLSATPTSASLTPGASQNITVAENNYAGSFSATSANSSVATVSPASGSGAFSVTGVGVGTTTVTFTDLNNHSVVVSVTVAPLALVVAPTSLSLKVGTSQGMTVSEQSYSGAFTATSASTSIATVTPASGSGSFSISGAAVGTTNVTFSDSYNQNVIVPVTVTPQALSVAPTTLSFTAAGQVLTSTASEAFYAGPFTATSSATSVATVTVSGSTISVTAVAAGTATITVTDSYGQTQTISVGVTTTGGVIQ